jgi:hypothetical protein
MFALSCAILCQYRRCVFLYSRSSSARRTALRFQSSRLRRSFACCSIGRHRLGEWLAGDNFYHILSVRFSVCFMSFLIQKPGTPKTVNTTRFRQPRVDLQLVLAGRWADGGRLSGASGQHGGNRPVLGANDYRFSLSGRFASSSLPDTLCSLAWVRVPSRARCPGARMPLPAPGPALLPACLTGSLHKEITVLSSSQATPVCTCPARRSRWCPLRSPWRSEDYCLPAC